jgi:tetratricopeptide (TPR) repeat protein
MPQDRVEEWLAADLTLDAIEAPERHDLSLASRVAAEALERFPSSMAPLHLLALVELERGQYAEARARLSALIDDTRAHGVELVLKNNLAWVDFLTRDEALLAEADAFSMEVIDLLPNAPSALGTRGAVLFWRGDLEESCRHLERARLLASTPSSRALNACCLALAWSRRGDQERARRLLEEARRDDQRCLLLDEATMAVA